MILSETKKERICQVLMELWEEQWFLFPNITLESEAVLVFGFLSCVFETFAKENFIRMLNGRNVTSCHIYTYIKYFAVAKTYEITPQLCWHIHNFKG